MRVLVFDTNALMDCWRYWYPIDRFEGFWTAVADACAEGRAIIPFEVADELGGGRGGTLSSWVQESKSKICTESGADVQRLVGQLVTRHDGFGANAAGGKNWADPFVVAHAVLRKTPQVEPIVITEESMAARAAPPKIPNVCVAEGIQCKRSQLVVKHLDLRFTLVV